MERLGRAIIGMCMLLAAIAPVAQESATGERQALQRGFSRVELGMSFQAANDELLVDPAFRYRGGPDVQFLPMTQIPIIDAEGRAFVDRGVFQFADDTLYVISVHLNPTRLDYFSVYESLVGQYGDPSRLDPGQAIWERDGTRISLERPLTVKYIDLELFNRIIDEGRMEEALDEITRERFLEQL